MYSYRTNSVQSSGQYRTWQQCMAAAVTDGEWHKLGSRKESADMAHGDWLCISKDGTPCVVRGEMP